MNRHMDRSRLAAALIACAGLSSTALAQTGSNIVRDLRPMVSISLTNPAPGTPNIALGIYDTGAVSVFIPPGTNSLWTVPIANGANPFANFGQVSNPARLSVAGMFGGSFGGPEQVNANLQTQTFSALANRNQTAPITGAAGSYGVNWYNGRFNNFIVGMAFYAGNAASRPLVGAVDPINAGYTPFQFGTTNANAAMAGVIADANDLLNNTYTSVNAFVPGFDIPTGFGTIYVPNPRVPTVAQSTNPNFLFPISLTPVNFAGAVQPSFSTSNLPVNGATIGPRPQITINAGLSGQLGRSQNNVGGDLANGSLAPNGQYIADTGAPGTDIPGGGPGLMGTDFFNGFGQYWDFSANPGNNNQPTLLMFGPRLQGDRDMVSTGALITVDRLSVGLDRTGVNQYTAFGRPAINIPAGGSNPNGTVNLIGTPIAAISGTFNATTIFRTHMTQSNAGYISGAEALGLQGATVANLGDSITSLSVGGERIAQRSTIYFSVDRASQGEAGGQVVFVPGLGTIAVGSNGFGGGVAGQRALGQHAADIFQADNGARPSALNPGSQNPIFVNAGGNVLRYNQDVMGLAGNAGPLASAAGWGNEDNLRDFDLRSIDGMIAANAATTMRNLDPVIRTPGDTHNPGSALGVAARSDVLGQNFNTFITLDTGSVTLTANGWSAADILRNNTAANGPGIRQFAAAATIGLGAGNAIDGIAMQRVGLLANLPLVAGTTFNVGFFAVNGYVALDSFIPYGGLLQDFGGIDIFSGFNADTMLFSLAPGSTALAFFDVILNRNLSAADIFITDFDGTFQLYAAAESMGLLASDNIDGLDVMPIPTPASLVLLALGGALASRRRRQA